MTQILVEAIRADDFHRATLLVQKYLRKYLGQKVYFYPVPDVFIPASGKTMTGIRFYISYNGSKSIRMNWTSNSNSTSKGLTSIDYFDGSKAPQLTPSHHFAFNEDQSIVKILPFMVDVVKGKIKESAGVFVNEEVSAIHLAASTLLVDFSTINEATYTSGEIAQTVHNVMNALKSGMSPRDQHVAGGNKKYGPRWKQVIDYITNTYPDVFRKEGLKRIVEIGKVHLIDAKAVLAAAGGGDDAVSFTSHAGTKETPVVANVDEESQDRMNYEEQLDALKTGVKLLTNNATNAIFLAGRGGTGKTQTVEDVLAAAGKTDGDGYFKITGSASPAGIYRLLFQHKKEILLFDDSDSALQDVEGRNLFKTASDTKKIRKISWAKGGKSYIDPDDYDEEDENSDVLPRSFEFTGKIIFISNLPLNKLDPDGALRTRGYVINIDPTNEEIYDYMAKICTYIKLEVDYPLDKNKRLEVVDLLKTRKIADKTANLRSLVRGLNTRAGIEISGGSAEEWQKFVKMFA